MDNIEEDLNDAELLDVELDDSDSLDGGVISDDYDDGDDLDDDSDDDDSDDYEDATADEIDFVVALYREDGAPVMVPLAGALANDLDDLIDQLRRLPGDAGACGFVSINGEFFVICRVRGRTVQVVLNDSLAATDWPIARDIVDYLGLEVPEEDDDPEPIGDLGLLADQGVSEFDLETIATDDDEDSDELVRDVMDKMKLGDLFDKTVSD